MRWLVLLFFSTLVASAQFNIGNPFYVPAFLRALSDGESYDPSADTEAVRWLRVEGTVGTNASNSAITNLVERKGGSDFTNLTALAGGPIISNNFLNGKSVGFFFITNYLLSASGQYSGLTEGQMFAVVKAEKDDGTTYSGWWRFNGADVQNVYYPFGTDIYAHFGSTTRHNGNPTADISQWHVLEIVSVSGEWTLYIDGVQQFTDASNTVGWDGVGSPELIGGNNGGSGDFSGAFAEAIVRNTRATGATRTSIYQYLKDQYGLSFTPP